MASRFSQFSIKRLKKPRRLLVGAGILTGIGTGAYFSIPEDQRDPANIGIVRFGRASSAVIRIVADYKWSLYRIPSPSEEYDATIRACHERGAQKLLQLAEKNGGVFIKVGQHIAAMEYLIPPEYTKTLYVLMSRAPQQSMEDVRYVIESEIGKPMEEAFIEFSEQPIGAASLAQVHTARSKDGEKLAVKVQHRKVYQNSITDMNTMELLVKLAARSFPEFRLMWLVEEVKKNLPNELDFMHEAKNMDKARKIFAHLEFLKIPQCIPELTTKRVLTMEFCEGSQVDDIEYLKKNKIDRHDVAKKLGKLFSEMVFIKGFLHADPHPGNVLVHQKSTGNLEIVLLDHGLYLNVDDRFRNMYSDLWMAILNADQVAIKKVGQEMNIGEYYGLFACMVTRRSWKSVTSGIAKSKMTSAEKQELREYAYSLLPQISEVMQRMPREMVLILKTNDLLRAMEHILGCHGRQDSMIEVSKCVIRCHHDMAIRHANNFIKSFRLRVSLFWSLFRLRLYEFYLIIKDDLGYA